MLRREVRTSMLHRTALFLGVWFILALLRAVVGPGWPGVAPGDAVFVVLAFILVPIVAFFAAYARSAAFRAFVESIDLRWLVLAQYTRVIGGVFLIYEASGRLPAGFALPAGWGDVAIGLAAPLVMLAIHARAPGARPLFYAWSALGILDLLMALSLGLLYSSSPLGVLRGEITMDPVSFFPLALIPTFGLPLFLIVHFATLLRVRELRGTLAAGAPA